MHIGYQKKDHSIYVYKARYATSIVKKYLDTSTVKTSTKFDMTTLPYYIIFTKADSFTRDDQVDKLTRDFNTHYISFIESFVYLLSTRVHLSFGLHK